MLFRSCWQAWKRYYQTGASPERLDYVRERLAMLDLVSNGRVEFGSGESSSEAELGGFGIDPGTTSDLTVKDDGKVVRITVPLANLTTKMSLRDKHMKEALEVDKQSRTACR